MAETSPFKTSVPTVSVRSRPSYEGMPIDDLLDEAEAIGLSLRNENPKEHPIVEEDRDGEVRVLVADGQVMAIVPPIEGQPDPRTARCIAQAGPVICELVSRLRGLKERADRDDAGVTIHACPPKGESTMPCCQRSPFEALSDRITTNPQHVNCDRVRLLQDSQKMRRVMKQSALIFFGLALLIASVAALIPRLLVEVPALRCAPAPKTSSADDVVLKRLMELEDSRRTSRLYGESMRYQFAAPPRDPKHTAQRGSDGQEIPSF